MPGFEPLLGVNSCLMVSYLRSIWTARFFLLALVQSDLRTRYHRSVIGIGWSLLNPIAMTAIICLVFSRFIAIDPLEYAPFLLAGMVTWNYIHGVTAQGCQCFLQGESYIRQYPLPLAIYPLRTALVGAIHFVIPLAFVILATWCLHGIGNCFALLSLIPTLVLLFAFTWSLAVLTGFATVYFQDSQQVIDVLFHIIFYATPIIYPASRLTNTSLAFLINLNPFGWFISLVRAPILHGTFPTATAVAVTTLAAAFTVTLASLMLSRFQKTLIFHL